MVSSGLYFEPNLRFEFLLCCIAGGRVALTSRKASVARVEWVVLRWCEAVGQHGDHRHRFWKMRDLTLRVSQCIFHWDWKRHLSLSLTFWELKRNLKHRDELRQKVGSLCLFSGGIGRWPAWLESSPEATESSRRRWRVDLYLSEPLEDFWWRWMWATRREYFGKKIGQVNQWIRALIQSWLAAKSVKSLRQRGWSVWFLGQGQLCRWNSLRREVSEIIFNVRLESGKEMKRDQPCWVDLMIGNL